jgi:hypothetical protein
MAKGQEERLITKKQSSLRQLHAAIEHLRNGDYECAVTLAGAAEGQLSGRVDIDFWQIVKVVAFQEIADRKAAIAELNETRDWLKHPTSHLKDYRYIHADDAWIACLRAAMQFVSVFRQQSSKMDAFFKRAEQLDFIARGTRPEYPPVSL